MVGIETITSQEHEQAVAMPNGEMRYMKLRVWNATVANLTLMALGSLPRNIALSD